LPVLSGDRRRCWPDLPEKKGIFGLQLNDPTTKPRVRQKGGAVEVTLGDFVLHNISVLNGLPGVVNCCPWNSNFGLGMTGDCNESIEKRRRDASDKVIKAHPVVWNRQRSPEQFQGELASHREQAPSRLRVIATKYVLLSPLDQIGAYSVLLISRSF
jgi:hypothetical protein